MNKLIFKITFFCIGSLIHAQNLENVLEADTIYVNINKGFSTYESKDSKSAHLPCFRYIYIDREIEEDILFSTCKWLDETPPYKKNVNTSFLNNKTIIDLDLIKKIGFKIVSRKFRGKIFYVVKNLTCGKIELTEAEFSSSYSSVEDYHIEYIDIKE
ncbi:hypothetical protein [Algibacter pacificus]|uniref:hypothetical protein n=1 Tax=Algibacter pacificus TaxID=2599389 RepID=UPI0011CC90F6|nr:hypothetical protein [Algibacter pacificus]